MVVSGGLALAIPSELVVRFLERGSRPTLGIAIQPVKEGLLVLQVNPNSAAERASLMSGDLLLGITTDDLSEAIEQAAGSVLKLQFRRGNTKREVSVAVQDCGGGLIRVYRRGFSDQQRTRIDVEADPAIGLS